MELLLEKKSKKLGIVAQQELCWIGFIVRMIRGNHTIYQNCYGRYKEARDRLMVDRRKNVQVEDQGPILQLQHNQRVHPTFRKYWWWQMCLFCEWSDVTQLHSHGRRILRVARTRYDRCPGHDVKIIIEDLNTQVDQEEEFKSTIGWFNPPADEREWPTTHRFHRLQ